MKKLKKLFDVINECMLHDRVPPWLIQTIENQSKKWLSRILNSFDGQIALTLDAPQIDTLFTILLSLASHILSSTSNELSETEGMLMALANIYSVSAYLDS